MIDLNTPLKEVKSWLRERVYKGEKCPCCLQMAKVYKRTITSAMAIALVHIYRRQMEIGLNEWMHVENYLKGVPNAPPSLRGDFPKLRFWGLLEKKDETRDDGSDRNGFYRITPNGVGFVRGEILVHKYIYIYNQRPLKSDGVMVSISDALGEPFDYQKLMNG